jgi:hypothetical protein
MNRRFAEFQPSNAESKPYAQFCSFDGLAALFF